MTPGDMFLLRQEDRVLWVQVKSSNTIISLPFLCFIPPSVFGLLLSIPCQVLEAGNGYQVVSVKGLELQETSCHSLEATR